MATVIRDLGQKRSRKNQTSCTIGVDDDNVDRISQLPDHIIYHILSFLPTSNAVRVSVLSKTWYGLFNSFHMSDFFESSANLLIPYGKGPQRMLQFANFVHSSFLKQCRQNSCVPKFRLSMVLDWSWTPQLLNLVDHCIQLATQFGVKELDLKFDMRYCLPLAIFSAKELVVCRLACCELNFPQEASMNWLSLRDLSLQEVSISDARIFYNLISACPSLEKISLSRCYGLSYLRLSGFTKLKEVKVDFDHSMEKIEIDILSLRTFNFLSRNYKGTLLDLTSCKNLRFLRLKFHFEQGIGIEDLIPQFPALEVLILEAVNQRSINISSQQLEKLQLSSAFAVETVNIDAPRLHSFKYDFVKFPPWFSLNKTSLREVALKLDFYRCFYRSNVIQHLKEALVNFKQIKLHTLDIECCWRDLDAIPRIGSNDTEPVLPDINHLKLKINLESRYIRDRPMIGKVYEVLVEGVIRMCHSESLLLKSGQGTNEESIKFLCRKLMCSYTGKISVA